MRKLRSSLFATLPVKGALAAPSERCPQRTGCSDSGSLDTLLTDKGHAFVVAHHTGGAELAAGDSLVGGESGRSTVGSVLAGGRKVADPGGGWALEVDRTLPPFDARGIGQARGFRAAASLRSGGCREGRRARSTRGVSDASLHGAEASLLCRRTLRPSRICGSAGSCSLQRGRRRSHRRSCQGRRGTSGCSCSGPRTSASRPHRPREPTGIRRRGRVSGSR